jgi:hypothetical protein
MPVKELCSWLIVWHDGPEKQLMASSAEMGCTAD